MLQQFVSCCWGICYNNYLQQLSASVWFFFCFITTALHYFCLYWTPIDKHSEEICWVCFCLCLPVCLCILQETIRSECIELAMRRKRGAACKYLVGINNCMLPKIYLTFMDAAISVSVLLYLPYHRWVKATLVIWMYKCRIVNFSQFFLQENNV